LSKSKTWMLLSETTETTETVSDATISGENQS